MKLSGLLLALAVLAPLPAAAANHALILWIGTYQDPEQNLVGIDLDANSARRIAAQLGVPQQNITELRNEQLTTRGFRQAFAALQSRLGQGDNAFIYYSGHGYQRYSPARDGTCVEGMVAYDGSPFSDRELTDTIVALSAKAGRLIIMNDSCFSGGHFDRSLKGGLQPKVWPPDTRLPDCGKPVNAKLMRTINAAKNRGANVVYLGASAANEIAFASPDGSIATIAWERCMQARGADGATATDFSRCAQSQVRGMQRNQTITLLGTGGVPVALGAPAPAATAVAAAPARPKPPAAEAAPQYEDRYSAVMALEQIRMLGAPNIPVDLRLSSPEVRIGEPVPNFTVRVNQPGHLYLLQVSSNGKSINMLFPNSAEPDNALERGTHTFPRPGWRFRASGPAGTNYLIAILSEKPRDFPGVMQEASGPFRSAANNRSNARGIVVEVAGRAQDAPGRYGASQIVKLKEVP